MTAHETDHSLGAGLIYEDVLPLGWRRLEGPPPAAQLAQLNLGNEAVLRAVTVLAEYRPETGEEHTWQAQELARLDFKLNLLLDLVGQILTRGLSLPPARPLRLGAQAVEWICPLSEAPPSASHAVMSLYLPNAYGRALELPGRVAAVENLPAGARVRVVFIGLGEAVQELLDKLIFRHHRRSIAQARIPRESS